MNPFSAAHFTVAVLTRIYNSSVSGQSSLVDLSNPDNRRSLLDFLDTLPAQDISKAIFNAVHFPGSLDKPVAFPEDLVSEASRAIARKFEA